MAKRKRKKAKRPKKLKTEKVTTIAVLLAIIAIVIIVIFSTTGITAQFFAPRRVMVPPTIELKPNTIITVDHAVKPGRPFESVATVQVITPKGVIKTVTTSVYQGKTQAKFFLSEGRYMIKVSAPNFDPVYKIIQVKSGVEKETIVKLSRTPVCCGENFVLLNGDKVNIRCVSGGAIALPGVFSTDVAGNVINICADVWLGGVKDSRCINVGSTADFHNGQIRVKLVNAILHPLAQIGFMGTFNIESCP